METPLKQRLVGATVLVALGVIFIPMLLEGGKEDARLTVSMEIPPQPDMEFKDRLGTPPKVINKTPPPPLDEIIASVKKQTSSSVEEKSGTNSSPVPSKPAVKTAPKAESRDDLKAAKSAGDSEGQWIVQAGSFSRETNAVILRDKLKTKGFEAFVETADTRAGPVYRVRMGPLAEREAAEGLVKRLKSSGDYRGMVMSYP